MECDPKRLAADRRLRWPASGRCSLPTSPRGPQPAQNPGLGQSVNPPVVSDLGVGDGRICNVDGEQLLAAGGQLRERVAQRGVTLGRQQLLLSTSGMVSASGTGQAAAGRRVARSARQHSRRS